MRESEPDLTIAGFSLSVKDWAFPGETDQWSRNTLRYSALVETPASVVCFGGFISAHSIKGFYDELSLAHSSLAGRAELQVCEETTFSAVVEMKSLGHAEITIEILCDFGAEKHEFTFGTDQTFLAESLRQLSVLLATYPPSGMAFGAAMGEAKSVSRHGTLSRIMDAVLGKRPVT